MQIVENVTDNAMESQIDAQQIIQIQMDLYVNHYLNLCVLMANIHLHVPPPLAAVRWDKRYV
jgi:hypothetical protein